LYEQGNAEFIVSNRRIAMKTPIALVLAAALLVPAVPAMAQPGGHDGPGDHRGNDNRGNDNRGNDNRGHDNRGNDNRGRDNRGPDNRGPGGQFAQFRKGDRFDRGRAPNYAVVDYHRYRQLSAPPRGYRWVRSGNDAVLIGITTGIVASVLAGAIR
jgi:Ni/Co efflux regulator RcnB